jgi:hypothetical protein
MTVLIGRKVIQRYAMRQSNREAQYKNRDLGWVQTKLVLLEVGGDAEVVRSKRRGTAP